MMPHDHPVTIEAQLLLLDVLACAAVEGWQAGRDLGSYAGDCPYSRVLVLIRDAWLHGFSAGRGWR